VVWIVGMLVIRLVRVEHNGVGSLSQADRGPESRPVRMALPVTGAVPVAESDLAVHPPRGVPGGDQEQNHREHQEVGHASTNALPPAGVVATPRR
jgi:hypothetical protein